MKQKPSFLKNRHSARRASFPRVRVIRLKLGGLRIKLVHQAGLLLLLFFIQEGKVMR